MALTLVVMTESLTKAIGCLRSDSFSAAMAAKGQPAPRFPQGSRAWVTELELTKLQQLIDSREALRASGDSAEVDRATLADEIAFLEGRRQFHEETLRSLEDAPDQFAIERPDVGAVTKEALAKGYQLPGPEVDPGARPEYYYYRHKPGNPDEGQVSIFV